MGKEMTPERLRCCQQLPMQMIHGAGPFCITEANWASVIGFLLSLGNGFFKRVCGRQWRGLLGAAGVVGRWREAGRAGGRRPGELPPSEAGDRKNPSILSAAPNMALGLER